MDRFDRIVNMIVWGIVGAVLLLPFYAPVHAWLRLHVEFFWGVLAGSSVQAVLWIRDRVRWMKWFSWQ
jgi:hypothetical protein